MLSRRHAFQVVAMAVLSALPLHTGMLAAQQSQTATVTLTIAGMT